MTNPLPCQNENDHGLTHGHLVQGAVVPGLCWAAPRICALFLGACDKSSPRLGLSTTPGSCEKGVLTNILCE
jgi:hypothetical protein